MNDYPEGVVKIRAFEKDFWIFKKKETWQKARETCKAHGTKLAVLANQVNDKLGLNRFGGEISQTWNLMLVWIGFFRHWWTLEIKEGGILIVTESLLTVNQTCPYGITL